MIDNRSIGTKYKNDLETHLNLDFITKNINFRIDYRDSKLFAEIRLADIISYSLYKTHKDETRRSTKLTNAFKKYNVNNLYDYISVFSLNSGTCSKCKHTNFNSYAS